MSVHRLASLAGFSKQWGGPGHIAKSLPQREAVEIGRKAENLAHTHSWSYAIFTWIVLEQRGQVTSVFFHVPQLSPQLHFEQTHILF